jgi:metallo-beta-lactamase family protein
LLTLTSLGGAGAVTGSKHMLEFGGQSLLVDCGLFQGPRHLRRMNWDPLPVDPATVGAVLLTRAHLDHCGYLPRLVKDGFGGPISATPAALALARLILLDSAYLQEKDAEPANRKGFSRHEPALPLSTKADAERVLECFRPVRVHDPVLLPGGAALRLRRAGHILGAASAEISAAGRVVLFSGDLGRYDDAVMPDPEPVEAAEIVVIESTNGNRAHERVDPAEAIDAVVERTARRGGTVVIPALAVGRVQALLYHLWALKAAGRLPIVPVYVDSPRAINPTGMLCAHPGDHHLSSEVGAASCAVATYVLDVEASKALAANRLPKVVMSASGHGDGRTRPAPHQGVRRGFQEHHPVLRLPGCGDARPQPAERHPGGEDTRRVDPDPRRGGGAADAMGACRCE